MTHSFVKGDIFQTRAQAMAVGLNATGRLENEPVYTMLHDRYPVFVSECHKRGRAGLLAPGSVWVWREGTPWVVGLVVRETPQGATRQRYVEAALLNLFKSWEHEGLRSMALMRLGDDEEWPTVRAIVTHYLDLLEQRVIVYEDYIPGLDAEAGHAGNTAGDVDR